MLAGLAVACAGWVWAAPPGDTPPWWRETRAIYAAHALSGAGGPLMKFPGQDMLKLHSFTNLPAMLADAQRLGSQCLYLVDYWEGGYENKGDYVPRADLGGPDAFRQGVASVQAQGGRVLLYLEAFIVHRRSRVGQQHGPEWAMLDAQGQPYAYYGRNRFYLMYPGRGSGWSDYLCALAEQLVRDYGVDGFHLDSYGLQWDWQDHHPRHPDATQPRQFNDGAIRLVRGLRERIRRHRPDAVVILEGCERPELLAVCDGGQLDAAAWQYSPLKVLQEKPWFEAGTYKAFTAHFSLPEMEHILDCGYHWSLAPWWFQPLPNEADFARMRRALTDQHDWYKRILTLWHWDNLLFANHRPRPADVDLFALRRDLEKQRYLRPGPPYDTPTCQAAVAAYEPLMRALLAGKPTIRTPAEWLRAKLAQAGHDTDSAARDR